MNAIFECLYEGAPHIGVGPFPAEGERSDLYPVSSESLREAVFDPRGAAVSIQELLDRASPIVVEEARERIVPLAPGTLLDAPALVTGFMGTHRSKFDTEPTPDEEFIAPNWLIKGLGSWLRVSGQEVIVPQTPIALLEEPEVALVFVNDENGEPHYVGFTFANDLNDIGLHRQNPWGWTPYAKLCDTSIVPALFLGAPPRTVTGTTRVLRSGSVAWTGGFSCGSDAIFQRVPDLIDHIFSFPGMRRSGHLTYLLLGADKASFHDGFLLEPGDTMELTFETHGVELVNEIRGRSAAAVIGSIADPYGAAPEFGEGTPATVEAR